MAILKIFLFILLSIAICIIMGFILCASIVKLELDREERNNSDE